MGNGSDLSPRKPGADSRSIAHNDPPAARHRMPRRPSSGNPPATAGQAPETFAFGKKKMSEPMRIRSYAVPAGVFPRKQIEPFLPIHMGKNSESDSIHPALVVVLR